VTHTLTVVTSNEHKAREVAAFFGNTVKIGHVTLEIPEIRSSDVSEIACEKARYAYAKLGRPLVVDDTEFSIDALKGFPGTYAAYVLSTLGYSGILRLMDQEPERNAHFTTAIAYADKTGVYPFTGTIDGTITDAPRGMEGFGYDPIFEVGGKTLAEIPLEEKSAVSHRARALRKFHDWYIERIQTESSVDTNR